MQTESRPRSFWLLMLLFGLSLLLTMLNMRVPGSESPADLSYTAFLSALADGKVAEVTVTDRQLQGKNRDGTRFVTILPAETSDLPAQLARAGVEQRYQLPPGQPWWAGLLPMLVWILLLGGFYMWSHKRQAAMGGPLPVNRTPVRPVASEERTVTFADVAGVEEVKADLEEVVDYLRHPARYQRMGARIPKGVLLYGPPGTGKTLVARAVAGEAGVPFFALSGRFCWEGSALKSSCSENGAPGRKTICAGQTNWLGKW